MEHATYTCSVSVSVGNITWRSTLKHLNVLGVCESYNVLAYYTRGLTRVKYACCLMATEPMLRFLRRRPSVLLGFRTRIIDVGVPF